MNERCFPRAIPNFYIVPRRINRAECADKVMIIALHLQFSRMRPKPMPLIAAHLHIVAEQNNSARQRIILRQQVVGQIQCLKAAVAARMDNWPFGR